MAVLRGKDSIGCMTEENHLEVENSFRGSNLFYFFLNSGFEQLLLPKNS